MRTFRLARARAAAALALVAFATGCITIDLPGGPPRPLVETVVFGREGPKVLMVEIEGIISETPESTSVFGSISQESMIARLREQLDKARQDDEVRALLLRINSPGGTVTASDILYEEISRFKRERGIPVVAQLMGIATSGGYYAAMAADEIVALPTSVTGSIGVIFMGLNFAGLMEKIGVENQTLVTGSFKDAGSSVRPMVPEERAQLQSVLDDLFLRFKDVVAQGRKNLSAEKLDLLADGRIYSAVQAQERGLIDGIGNLEESVRRAERRANLESSRVVTYHRPREWRENLYTKSDFPDTLQLKVLPELPGISRPAFMYLWAPGAGGVR